jgi:hypothetical protein
MKYHTIERRAKNITVAIYVTEEEVIPKYVDDRGCRKLGEFVVNIPNPTDESSSFQYGKRWFFW